ncbi:helix-turn-helix transcriptional regulator, partial [Salmonella enterica]|nr:helix-turn-helix transcriptional regulator [Salmonella enterica]EBP7951435.1 helix-turn-helix transcriptional regulator [Salmonella enterica]EGA4477535.1 helix-turn-helix transcriptional regulator [Salmonella enterica]
ASCAEVNVIENCILPVAISPRKNESQNNEVLDIFYIMSGCVEIMFNNFSRRNLNPGDVVFFKRKKNDYFIISEKNESHIIQASIKPNGIYRDLMLCNNINNLLIFSHAHSDYVSSITELVKLLLQLKHNETPGRTLIEMPIAVFFIQLFITQNFGFQILIQEEKNNISQCMLDMVKKPGYHWKIKTMAMQHNMGVNLFINEFRKVSGDTPFNFLKKIRLNRAKQLLENTTIPISIIASECGYNSHASFTTYIKKEFGLTPVNLRKMSKQKKNKRI